MRRFLIPSAVVIALTAFAFWWFSPGQVIMRRTHTLLDTLTLESGGGRASRQLRVYSLNALLASRVELITPTIEEANGTFDRAEIESGFSWLSQQARQTRFDLQHIHSVKITGERGVIVFSLEGLVELPAYRLADGTYRVTFEWRQEDGSWRLARATWLEEDS